MVTKDHSLPRSGERPWQAFESPGHHPGSSEPGWCPGDQRTVPHASMCTYLFTWLLTKTLPDETIETTKYTRCKKRGVRMASTVVRLEAKTHARLREMAEAEHRSMGEIVTDLLERYEREQFWDRVDASLAKLKADPVAWKEYQDEIAVWDATSGDGLENEEPYYTPEEAEIEAEFARTQTE